MKFTYTALAACIVAVLAIAGCGSQQKDAVSVLHHFNTGNEAYRIQDYRRAIIHFDRALEMDEESPDIQYNLGLAHYRAGNYKAAVAAFMAALRARPGMAEAHYNLALAHDRLFNADAAHTNYNKYRNMMIAQPRGNARRGNARPGAWPAIPAVGKRSATMANGAATARRTVGTPPGGGAPTALTAGSPASRNPMRGRPTPKAGPGRSSAARAQGSYSAARAQGKYSAARAQTLTPRKSAGRRPASASAPQTRAAPPTPRQNTQNPSGDRQKWWIQDQLNRTQ